MSRVNQGGEQKSGLTSRQKAIIQILTQFTAAHPVTVAAIADALNLSSRTVLRDLPKIEAWLQSHDFTLLRKPGVGLLLDESLETRNRILALLEEAQVEQAYTKEERQRLILGELLYTKQPLKFYYFTSKYKISDGTLSNDLDILGEWLLQYHITLQRKPGIGIYTEGTEADYRQAIANVVYEFMSEEEIIQLLSGAKTYERTGLSVDTQKRLFHFIDDETLAGVEAVLAQAEQQLHIRYTDSAYMGLLVHIALAVKRLRNHEKIDMDAEKLESLTHYPEFSAAEEIGKGIAEYFAISLPKEEIGYIAMHCISAQIWLTRQEDDTFSNRMNIRQLVRGMVEIIEEELGVPLSSDERLLHDLCEHIPSVLHRLALHVKIKNAQLDAMKENYGEIYQAVNKSCRMLKNAAGGTEVPEAEVAFIAMYVCAAVEQIHTIDNKISVVVVCPTGIGTSKMLAVQLKKEYHEIEVKETISAFRINIDKLRREGIALIVSTVRLDVDFPVVCVNPILSEQDKKKLQSRLQQIQKQPPLPQKSTEKTYPTQSDVAFFTKFGEEVLQLLQHVTLTILPDAEGKSELLYVAAGLFAEDEDARKLIADSLAERERMGGTYISEFQMLLLHCRTSGVKHGCFGYIRLERPLFQTEGFIYGAIVMLVPKNGDFPYTDMMSQISAALMEQTDLIEALKWKEKEAIVSVLEKSILQYYKNIVFKRMECSI